MPSLKTHQNVEVPYIRYNPNLAKNISVVRSDRGAAFKLRILTHQKKAKANTSSDAGSYPYESGIDAVAVYSKKNGLWILPTHMFTFNDLR